MEVVTVIDKPTKFKQGMEVYCRIKGGKKCSDSCMNIISSNEVQIFRTDGRSSVRYKFKKVFDETASQKYVFDEVAFKLIQDLLSGKSGLLFAYGVTGSGKTYTMTGTKDEPGIMPRCLDVLFNSIAPFQVDKCVFKPDKLNGFEIQSSADAQLERDCVIQKQIVQFKNVKYTLENKGSEERWGWSKDSSRVPYLNEDNSFAVFITYVEIYNNNVYDLLEDFYNDVGKPRPLQSKIIREDSTHTMYVHGVTEIEVSSTEEAFDIFYTGERRKHIARTTLNNESSRAHTVFNIRVVQAPLDEAGENVILDKNFISISQLSLVDLAGSERSLRTLNTGQRLREAGNINNSLMTLRTCLEILRDNQNGCNKIIPYRESRLTHLFKNYFDGDGQVSMIICASPSLHDLDETVHVMKFAEMTQEIQMSQKLIRTNFVFTPGRRKFKQVSKEHAAQVHDYNAIVKDPNPDEKESVTSDSSKISDGVQSEEGVKTPLDIICDFPSVGFVDYNENHVIGNAINHWEKYIETFTNLTNNVVTKFLDVREKIVKKERDKFIMAQELKSVKSLFEVEKNKVADLESKSRNATGDFNQLKRKLQDSGLAEKKLKRQLFETKMELERVRIENNNIKERIKTKVRETEEKCNQELEKVLQNQKNVITHELRKKDRKLREVKRIVSEAGGSKTPSLMSLDILDLPIKYKEPQAVPKACGSPASITPRTNSNNTDEQSGQSNSRTTIRKGATRIPTSNRRHRRSRSVDVWLDHRPAMVVPLGTVMQPKMEKRKSITKLTQAKDITEKTSKYCLMTQAQDSDGDLETRLYKGDVIPTSGGGAQVMFNDIEILKQISPTQSPMK